MECVRPFMIRWGCRGNVPVGRRRCEWFIITLDLVPRSPVTIGTVHWRWRKGGTWKVFPCDYRIVGRIGFISYMTEGIEYSHIVFGPIRKILWNNISTAIIFFHFLSYQTIVTGLFLGRNPRDSSTQKSKRGSVGNVPSNRGWWSSSPRRST